MEMLATILDLPNDSSLTWDEREEQWRLSGKIYRTRILHNQQMDIRTVCGLQS